MWKCMNCKTLFKLFATKRIHILYIGSLYCIAFLTGFVRSMARDGDDINGFFFGNNQFLFNSFHYQTISPIHSNIIPMKLYILYNYIHKISSF